DLKGAGSRWSEGQLRLRIVDASRLYPNTIMPPYYRVDGLVRVAPALQGKPTRRGGRLRTWSAIFSPCATNRNHDARSHPAVDAAPLLDRRDGACRHGSFDFRACAFACDQACGRDAGFDAHCD